MIDVQDLKVDDGSVPAFFKQLTRVGARLFGDDEVVACGLMVRRESGQTLFCSAFPAVAGMYQVLDAQHALGECPAPQTLRSAEVQVADDTSHPDHPPFFALPASAGFASILSVPLRIGAKGSAALNFYAGQVAFFTPDRQHSASIFAEQTATSVEMRLCVDRYQDLTGNMRAAMESRTSIDMAIGIIIAQNRCSQEEAALILKRASNARNAKLRELAKDLVVHASGGTPATYFTP